MSERLTFFDIEILNNDPSSICSIGIVVLEDMTIVDKYYSLIKPRNLSFDKYRYDVHHIKPSALKKQKTFKQVWKEIAHYFEGQIVISHDVQNDMSHLRAALKVNNIPFPFLYMSCTNVIAHALEPHLKKYNVSELCEYLHISFDNAHNALGDAIACAKVYRELMVRHHYQTLNEFHYQNHIEYGEMRDNYYRNIISPDHVSIIKDDSIHPLSYKTITFVGILDKHLEEKTKAINAFVSKDVNTHTNYVVIGKENYQKIRYGKKNKKIRKAINLIKEGQDLKIVHENEYIQLLTK